MSQLRSGTLDDTGGTISFDVREGSGPTVVALHGLGSSRANDVASRIFDWSPVAGRGRRLLRYDARGHGRSSVLHPTPDDFTWPRLAEDLLDLLAVTSPGEPVDAVGVSMGVGTLLHAAVRQPERFRRLALVIPPTAWATRTAQCGMYLQMAELLEAQGTAALAAAVAEAPTLPILAEGGWVLPGFDVADNAVAAILRGSAATDLPDPEALTTLRQPVLLRLWVNDPAHPLSTAERLADLLPRAALDTTATADDVRTLTSRVADFFAAEEPDLQRTHQR
jgi:3-oxoadipate enol-lactonase